ncbi:MAG: DNA mismatch repair endonuclease MutL [Saprospiraceae bacterium]|nr:DNA mismatch repair endonuclease MutL [Saprospiraceae bacterium]
MADVIQLLPDAIANQIAAGEVIQRPASVVKELMENAIDAGSNQIKLIVKDAGRTLIQVIDNGCGMSETDARLSFERHATSKIKNAQDLFAIRTMGFRGEALASIAAVAQVEMRTRRAADELGVRLVVEATDVKTQEACQCAPGTNIAVKNLFYNVPARRNFLKAPTAEMRHIIDEFQRIAIAHEDLFFSLHHNNEEILHLPPGNLRQRLVGIFGQVYNKRLVPVSEDTDVINISGYIGKPEFARKTRGEQLFFVNNRFIRSGYLNHAVVSAYDDLLPKEAFPFYAIFIEIDPARIDINVHPTKQEIKFEDEHLIYNYLRVAVRHALGQYSVMPTLDFEQDPTFTARPIPTQSTDSNVPPTIESSSINWRQGRGTGKPSSQAKQQWEQLYEGLQDTPGDDNAPGGLTIESEWPADNPSDALLNTPTAQKEPYQIHGAYIVSQIKSGFVLIDQQAAHERILYEQFLKALSQRSVVSQQQLFPKPLMLPPADANLLRDILPDLNALGFNIQVHGPNSFVISGLPAEMAGKKDESLVVEMLIEQYKANVGLKLDVHENIARAMAKSAALRRGQILEVREMQSLIDHLFACELPYKSPSGRLCFVTYDLDELSRRFDG